MKNGILKIPNYIKKPRHTAGAKDARGDSRGRTPSVSWRFWQIV